MDLQRFYRNNKKLVWGMGALIVGSIVVYMVLKKRCGQKREKLQADVLSLEAKLVQTTAEEKLAKDQLLNLIEGSDAYMNLVEHINNLQEDHHHMSYELEYRKGALSKLWC